MATCFRCKQTKPLNEFTKNKGKPSGYDNCCKRCNNERVKAWVEANPEKRKQYRQEYYEKNKESLIEKSKKYLQENFEKMKEAKRQYQLSHRSVGQNSLRLWRSKPENKIKESERRKKWAQEHPEEIRVKNHNRRVRMRSQGERVTAAEWKALKEKYGNKCIVPGCDRTDVTMDHVIPISKGGRNTIDNIQPLCGHHNFTKHTKHIDYRKGSYEQQSY
jgi:5-methylcytosine-specific restriction endonuclease McrA